MSEKGRPRKEIPLAALKQIGRAITEATDRLAHLPEDIKLIRQRENLGLTQLGHSCGVSKTAIWSWQCGLSRPSNPVVLLALLMWAEKLKAGPDVRLLPPNPLALLRRPVSSVN